MTGRPDRVEPDLSLLVQGRSGHDSADTPYRVPVAEPLRCRVSRLCDTGCCRSGLSVSPPVSPSVSPPLGGSTARRAGRGAWPLFPTRPCSPLRQPPDGRLPPPPRGEETGGRGLLVSPPLGGSTAEGGEGGFFLGEYRKSPLRQRLRRCHLPREGRKRAGRGALPLFPTRSCSPLRQPPDGWLPPPPRGEETSHIFRSVATQRDRSPVRGRRECLQVAECPVQEGCHLTPSDNRIGTEPGVGRRVTSLGDSGRCQPCDIGGEVRTGGIDEVPW